MNQTLDELIPQYAMNKAELDSYKKICDRENAEIKNIMLNLGLDEKTAGGYQVKRIVQKRETINEDVLISLFTSVPAFVQIADECGIVKTKEYIDYDALESAIYNGRISSNILNEINKAREVKEVVTLRLSKAKEDK